MGRKKGVLYSFLVILFELLSAFFVTPLIIRTLGQAEYGVYKLAYDVNAYLLLLDLGMSGAVTRFIAKYKTNGDKQSERVFLGIATVYYVGIAVITIVLGCVLIAVFPSAFSKGLDIYEIRLGQRLLAVIVLNYAVILGTTAYANTLVAYEQFEVLKGSASLRIVLKIICVSIALLNGKGSMGVVVIDLVLTIILRFYYMFYVLFRLSIRPQLHGVNSLFLKEVFSYSSFILLQMIATQLNSTIDSVLIGSMVEASAVIIAVYGVGSQIVQYFQSVGTAYNSVLMPGVVRLVEKKADSNELTKEMIKVGRLIFMVLVPIWVCFIVNGRQFVSLWAGDENVEAYVVASILMSVQLFVLTETIGYQILWAMNEHKEQACMKFVAVVLNIGLSVLLIQWDPLIGATIGTLISFLVGDIVVMNYVLKRKVKLNLIYYYKELLSGIVLCAACSAVAGILFNIIKIGDGWWTLMIRIIFMLLIYAITMIGVGLNSFEKEMMKTMILKCVPIANSKGRE